MTADRVQDRFVTLNGLRLHFRDWEKPIAPALVILHGLAYNARSWDPIARAMNDRYRVLVLDQRGHSESDWSDDYSGDRLLEDITAFISEQGLKRFSFLAHSMGGRVAYTFAAAHPEMVERLVIVDIGPENMSTGARRIATTMQARDSFGSLEEAYRFAREQNPRPPETEQRERTRSRLKQREDGKWVWNFDPALQSPIRPDRFPDAGVQWAALAKISCPTLIVRGAESDVLSRETAAKMASIMPQAHWVEIPDASHSPQFDNPSAFLNLVREFLVKGKEAY